MLTFPFLVPDQAQKRQKAAVLTQHPLYDKATHPNRLYCSFVTEHGSRTYALFESKQSMLNKLSQRDITTWFAIVEAETPVSLYMDMEMPRKSECDFLLRVQQLVRWFISFVMAEYNLVDPDLEWFFFDATTEEKYSIHVHCPRLVFQSVVQLNKAMERFSMIHLMLKR